MLKSWLSVGLVSFMLIGCADSASDNETQSETEESVTVVGTESTDAEAEVKYTVTEAPSVQEKVAAPASGLNPAHGQPGHDCDIEVGAPLNGSGGKSQPALAPNLATRPAAPSQPATGALNPAHGQPGHDCGVAVGAPLPAK